MNSRARVFRSILTVASLIVLGKAFGAAREIVLAAKYGTNEVVDAFLIANSVVNWPLSVWLSSLTVFLVPFLVRARMQSASSPNRVLWELYVTSGVLGVLSALLVTMVLPAAVQVLVPGESTGVREHLREMLPMMVVSLLLGFLSAVLAIRLIASERHINALIEGVPALAVTLAILAYPDQQSGALIWGTIAGAIAYLAIVMSLQPWIAPSPLSFKSEFWSTFASTFAIVSVGQAVLSSVTLIDQFIVAQLGSGSVAELGYANRILSLALAIGATAISRVTLPMFSADNAQSSGAAPRDLWFWVRCFFGAGCLGLAVAWLLAPSIVSLLFERGAFSKADVAAVSDVLRLGLLQLPFYFSAIVCTQMLAARSQYLVLLQVSVLMAVTKIASNYLLIDQFGVGGVQLATAIMYVVALIFLSSKLVDRASAT